MAEDALIPLGRIVGTHGIRGLVKVVSYAESVDSFQSGKAFWLKRRGTPEAELRIVAVRPHKRGLVMALEGVDSIEAAQSWVGCELCLPRADLPLPEEGTYYWHDILGLDVLTVDGRRLGKVSAILPTGSNDVYVVRDKEKEVLVPAIDSVVVEVDIARGVLRVDLPEGLED